MSLYRTLFVLKNYTRQIDVINSAFTKRTNAHVLFHKQIENIFTLY